MRRVLCTVHEGQVSKAQILALEDMLRNQYKALINPGQKPFIVWTVMPEGQGFTEGKPSEVSWVIVEVDNNMEQAKRETAMLNIAEAWADIAKVSTGNLMLTLCEQDLFARYYAAFQQRIDSSARPAYFARVLWNLFISKLSRGYYSMQANY